MKKIGNEDIKGEDVRKGLRRWKDKELEKTER